ncbi:MAG: alpha/beta fold hydrolase [Actinomycetia bacterium]|nr:alpha/beta fold hydrolase [Actinomycetes bacterium]
MRFPVDGCELEVEVGGPAHAPAVLCWNGARCTIRQWDHVVRILGDQFRFVRFDVRGTGGSSPTDDPDTQYRFEQYAADAVAILDSLGIDQVIVWSMAWGSRAALAFLSLYPERVIKAALLDASIGAADPEAQRAGHQRALSLQAAAGIEPFELPPGTHDHAHPDSVGPALDARLHFDLRAAAHSLAVPLLVATGDCDPNLVSSRELVELAPDARLIVMENVGHGSVRQRPDLTAEILRGFALER